MAQEVIMPKWGLTMKEGKLARWLKAEGDTWKPGKLSLRWRPTKSQLGGISGQRCSCSDHSNRKGRLPQFRLYWQSLLLRVRHLKKL